MRSANLPAEDEQVMEGKVFAHEHAERRGSVIGLNGGGFDSHGFVRSRARSASARLVVDDPDASVRLQSRSEIPKKRDPVVDLGIGVNHENCIEGMRWEIRIRV